MEFTDTQNLIEEPDNTQKEFVPKSNIDYEMLVLSGGSIKGLVTLGAIQCACDNFLIKNIKTYVGTSSGSIICYLLAIGYTPVEIIVYISTNRVFNKLSHFDFVAMMQGRGASSFNSIHEHLEKMTISKIGYLPTMSDVKKRYDKKLIFVTYNLCEETSEYLSFENYPELPCLTAIRMSSNLPLIFEPFKYGNSFYIDGGISNNFPIDIEKNGIKTLGICLANNNTGTKFNPNINSLEFIYKVLYIPIHNSTEINIQKCASENCKIIKLRYDKLNLFDFNINSKDNIEMFSSGYEQMSTFL